MTAASGRPRIPRQGRPDARATIPAWRTTHRPSSSSRTTPPSAEALVEGIGDEGYDVHWETTGGGGVAYARDHSPQLIVLDVRLPDGSGFDFCRQMRQLGLRQPILMLTVQSDEVDKVLGLEMGADDYLTKPYRLRELIARIRSLLRRAYGELASTEADVLYAGDLTIDRTRATVTREGRSLNLTPTEFRLLVFLAQHPGQVFFAASSSRTSGAATPSSTTTRP